MGIESVRSITNRRGDVDASPRAVRTRRTRSGAPSKSPGKTPTEVVLSCWTSLSSSSGCTSRGGTRERQRVNRYCTQSHHPPEPSLVALCRETGASGERSLRNVSNQVYRAIAERLLSGSDRRSVSPFGVCDGAIVSDRRL
jgi:hypothetical protein